MFQALVEKPKDAQEATTDRVGIKGFKLDGISRPTKNMYAAIGRSISVFKTRICKSWCNRS